MNQYCYKNYYINPLSPSQNPILTEYDINIVRQYNLDIITVADLPFLLCALRGVPLRGRHAQHPRGASPAPATHEGRGQAGFTRTPLKLKGVLGSTDRMF